MTTVMAPVTPELLIPARVDRRDDPLVLLADAERAIERVSTIPEAKQILDQAETIRGYTKRLGLERGILNRVAALAIKTQRKLGAMLVEMPKQNGARDGKTGGHDVSPLKDLGIAHKQSSRWQSIAGIPDDDFDAFISDALESDADLTTNGALALAKRIKATQKAKPESPFDDAETGNAMPSSFEVRTGDCVEELAKIESGSVSLIFADPPYNIGVDYGGGVGEDRRDDAMFMSWVEQWVEQCARVLTPTGSFWVMINQKYGDHFGVILRRHLNWRASVTWYETFGVNCRNNFGRTSRRLFYFTQDAKRFTFNRKAVSRPSDRQVKYNDARANPDGKIMDDVWQVPRVCGTAKERIKDVPTQVPLTIMRRIVGCSANPGDLVLDPFSGSGTTGVAAIELGRHYVGIEKNPDYASISVARLRNVTATPATVDSK